MKTIKLGVVLLVILIVVQLLRLQVFHAGELQKLAVSQYLIEEEIEARRGEILDRNQLQLTTTLGDYVSFEVRPESISDPERMAVSLAGVTDYSKDYFLNRLKKKSKYVYLVRRISPEKARVIENLECNLIRGLEPSRVYPYRKYAAQILGYTSADNVGISGIEHRYEALLGGTKGERIIQRDVKGGRHLQQDLPYTPPKDGGDVMLTIDIGLQEILEEELSPAVKYYNAITVCGLIMDPRDATILAMVSMPTFDPHNPANYPDSLHRNRNITDIYEMGSVFKVFPVAMVIEKGLATPETLVDCGNGSILIHGIRIKDYKPYGIMSLTDVVVFSSNVGVIRISWLLDDWDLYNMATGFGIGAKTGIELPGETRGILHKPDTWSRIQKHHMVIGHTIGVSALQMATGYAALANGGWFIRPSVIRATRQHGGEFEYTKPDTIGRMISAQTSETMTDIMIQVVERGTGQKARIEGMPIAAKTGTGQRVNHAEKKFYEDRYTSSLIGWFPARNPRYLVVIMVDDPVGPNGEKSGGLVAAPLFRNVALRVLERDPELWSLVDGYTQKLAVETRIVPDVHGRSLDRAKQSIRQAGLKIKVFGTGSNVLDQEPEAGVTVPRGAEVCVVTGPGRDELNSQVVVPILTGLSLRDALVKISESGLNVKFEGSGRVVKQSLTAGKRVAEGSMCTLICNG